MFLWYVTEMLLSTVIIPKTARQNFLSEGAAGAVCLSENTVFFLKLDHYLSDRPLIRVTLTQGVDLSII